jgi:hypothetical protein
MEKRRHGKGSPDRPGPAGEKRVNPVCRANKERGKKMSDPMVIRIICAAIAVVLLGVIVLRRKRNAED